MSMVGWSAELEQQLETQDDFCRLVGQSMPAGLAISHWVGCINAIKCVFQRILQNFLELSKSVSNKKDAVKSCCLNRKEVGCNT